VILIYFNRLVDIDGVLQEGVNRVHNENEK